LKAIHNLRKVSSSSSFDCATILLVFGHWLVELSVQFFRIFV